MADVKQTIKEKLEDLDTPEEFAEAMNEIGMELMDSGELDSDEVVWEVARQIWKDMDPSFEAAVSDEFDRIVEES